MPTKRKPDPEPTRYEDPNAERIINTITRNAWDRCVLELVTATQLSDILSSGAFGASIPDMARSASIRTQQLQAWLLQGNDSPALPPARKAHYELLRLVELARARHRLTCLRVIQGEAANNWRAAEAALRLSASDEYGQTNVVAELNIGPTKSMATFVDTLERSMTTGVLMPDGTVKKFTEALQLTPREIAALEAATPTKPKPKRRREPKAS